uniref:Ig-like domain-containing protein n=1 Tax=Meloidogyne enterolobii TaxID=390850 RepID=A0A6V7UGY0_MELEN|nr:unnamed protein product [Meloidogyne enterolobii]
MALDQTNIEMIENESHTLDCPLENDGGSTTELHWTKDEMPIGNAIEQQSQYQSHIQRSMSGKKLHLMKAQRMDSGAYKCIAKNAAGLAEAIINVLVLVPPRIEDPHGYRTLEALVNDSVQIDCIASGVPTPKIEWSHNGRSLSSEDSASLYFENGRSKLHILSVQPKNAGIYSCTATNKAGNSDMDIFLDVIGPPTIRAPATELNVIEGSEQRLECVVGGHPSPRVEWRKSGSSDNDPLAVQQQQEEDKHTEEHAIFTEHSYFLHIHSAGQQHAGRYTCIAKNKGGEDRLAIQLNVLVPPSIDEGERLLRVIEGGTASFECPAKGSPTPKILWRRMPHGTVLNSEDENIHLEGIGVNRNILLIKALKPEDAGRYMCEASNEAGNATAEFLLEILRRPILFANPSNLLLRVLEGAQAKFECQANGNPEPSVSWLRAGRPIGEETSSSNNNLIFSPRGDSLMLVKARRSDSGEYTCRLNNSVGEAEATFTLTVLVPPHINETLDQNPRALRNQEIRLNCPVIGFPTPTVQWLKDGKQLHFTERIIRGKISDYQNDLWLEAVSANDAGRYTCQAVNEVGQLNTDFELEVIAPPEFASEGKRNFEVIEGDSVTLVCPVEANPFPEITWLHGTDPIDTKNAYFSDDKKNLTLLHASLSDGGKYICNATNEAGNSELDLQLRVFVPPKIDKSNLVASPLAILGKDMFLECPASGTPQPSVLWHKDERQITQLAQKYILKEKNQTLSIKNIIPEDQGLYTCTVQNEAGQLREEFRLEVLLPPEMEEETAKPGDGRVPGPPLSKQEGEQLELECPLKIKSASLLKQITESLTEEEIWRRMEEDFDDGRRLRIAWSKDGRPLEPGLNANIEISEYPGKRLQLHTTSISDSGEYKCIASNRAGQSYVKFLVEILSKPKIDTSRNAPEPHVIAGRPITLCGNPPPTIRWFLNGVDIAKNKNFRKRYRLLDQGHGLELQPTTQDDIGLWTCQAENAAGSSVANISLDVWVVPTTKMQVEDSNPLKPLGSSLTLLCAVNGNPEPVIHWSLRGQTIIPSPGRLIISDGGQRLEILNLRSEDAGEYRCEAQNEVGDSSDSIKIDILVPPKIDKEAVELNPRLPLGRSFTLFCDVKAKPEAKITWTFNGIPLENGGGLPFLSIDNGKRKFLQIDNISLLHRGIYRCNAFNAAGNDSIEYKIDVFDPPKIELRGGTTQVLENHDVVLACNASGEPPPVIAWQRNGVLVETGARYSVENSFLKVVDVRSSDSGIYVCVATNEAGTDQQAFTLEVLVLPKVSLPSQLPTQLSVPQGGNVTLGPCKGQGYPPPHLLWSIADKNKNDDFVPINSSTMAFRKEDYKIINNESNTTSSLYLLDVKQQKDNSLQFRCSATNSAGASHIEFNVSIIVPPVLVDNNNAAARELRIIEGQLINIPCGVRLTGQNDNIQWIHNGKPIEINQKLQQNNEVEPLIIKNITLKEAGNYTCSVRNSAGSVNSTVKVVVGIPPKVDKNNGIRVAVSRGNTAQLHCEAFGFPPPKIHWLRDQMPLNKYMPTAVTGSEQSTSGVVVSENKRTATAILHDIKIEHAGFYNCKAENWAGIDNKTVELVVLIRPMILPERDQIRLESGDIAIITCNSSGTPKPTISWQKISDPQKDIVADLKKYFISDDGHSLTILNVGKDDHGIYRCIAKNEAGQAIGIRKIDVKLSQGERSVNTKRDRIYVECDENGLPIKSTYVKARGDRPQQSNDPYIHWNEESDIDALLLNGTDGLMTLCMPKMEDESNVMNRETRRVSPLPSANLSCSSSNNCQYKCLDLANGSSRCICPDGYSLSEDGRCLDLDECKNDIYPCISDQLCFNKLGTFSCINNLCPPKFHLDKTNQQCLPSCQNCTELPIRLYMLGLPKGVAVNTALLRLSAHDKNGRLLKRTKFNIRAESNSFNTNALNDQNSISYRPTQFHFGITAENDGRATLHSRRLLLPGSEFLLSIQSTSSNDTSDRELKSTDLGKWVANYMVLIAVSENLF